MKNGPEIGAIGRGGIKRGRGQAESGIRQPWQTNASEAEIGEFPIALRGAGRDHQQLVDGGQIAAS
jgi:hypothetical protein